MAYVSCKYGPAPFIEGLPQQIVCTDENGQEWSVPGEDCQVGDWLRFVEDGGTVDPYEPPGPVEQPPTLTALAPTSAFIGDPDLTLYCIGENFTEQSVILFNEGEEPTTFASASQVSTVVKPSTASGAWTVPVQVKTGDQVSAAVSFTFIERTEP